MTNTALAERPHCLQVAPFFIAPATSRIGMQIQSGNAQNGHGANVLTSGPYPSIRMFSIVSDASCSMLSGIFQVVMRPPVAGRAPALAC
jgi:hypothetical protein